MNIINPLLENPQSLQFVITIVAAMGVFTYVAWLINKRKHSLLVRIKDYPEKVKVCKKNGDNTVQIVKGKRGKAGWTASYTRNCLVPLKGLFSPPYALDIFPNSTKAIVYDWDLKKIEQPKWNKQQSQEFIDAEALKNRGKGLGTKTPLGIWIVAILVIVVLVLQFMQMRGIRIV
jgi:hypothetical protein